MAFFKPSVGTSSSKLITRLHQLIWVLVYGGLLTFVLGLSIQRTDDAVGWSMVLGGALVTALGVVLIYVRSRLKTGP